MPTGVSLSKGGPLLATKRSKRAHSRPVAPPTCRDLGALFSAPHETAPCPDESGSLRDTEVPRRSGRHEPVQTGTDRAVAVLPRPFRQGRERGRVGRREEPARGLMGLPHQDARDRDSPQLQAEGRAGAGHPRRRHPRPVAAQADTQGRRPIWFYFEGQVVYLEQVHTSHPNQTKT